MRLPTALRRALELVERERRFLIAEVTQIAGLMPLLMKRRNGGRWTREDRAQIVAHLRRMTQLSPYLVVLVMPGGFALLPVLAWWLDRRRRPRAPRSAGAGTQPDSQR
ncbi:MAG: hypothetical protein RML56_03090 [Burkholderiales bacterium]|nr:hypothetical protein [Burkholderiales bacterium]